MSRNPDAICEQFAKTVGAHGLVQIKGAGTRPDIGGAVAENVPSVTAPVGIVEYFPDEMIVRVKCGTTVAELNEVLAKSNQRCALAERGGTVGGAIAVGENHLEVLGRGRLRDSVLQIRYVSNEGKVITGGGATVKNVSGFDLPKLFVGSLGTLGFLSEVVLRTNPKPAFSQWVIGFDIAPQAVLDMVYRPGAVLFCDVSATNVIDQSQLREAKPKESHLAEVGEAALLSQTVSSEGSAAGKDTEQKSPKTAVLVLLEGHHSVVEAEFVKLQTLGLFEPADALATALQKRLPKWRVSLTPQQAANFDKSDLATLLCDMCGPSSQSAQSRAGVSSSTSSQSPQGSPSSQSPKSSEDVADAQLAIGQRWVASIGVGTVWTAEPPTAVGTGDGLVAQQPGVAMGASNQNGLTELHRLIKAQFDPQMRLNPNRKVEPAHSWT